MPNTLSQLDPEAQMFVLGIRMALRSASERFSEAAAGFGVAYEDERDFPNIAEVSKPLVDKIEAVAQEVTRLNDLGDQVWIDALTKDLGQE